jgi:hypothetical protein
MKSYIYYIIGILLVICVVLLIQPFSSIDEALDACQLGDYMQAYYNQQVEFPSLDTVSNVASKPTSGRSYPRGTYYPRATSRS